MDEFTGSVKEFKGLFKKPKTNIPVGSLHQQICNTSKNQFDLANGHCNLYGLDCAMDEQITNWRQRKSGIYRKLQFPKTIEGMMNVNAMKKSFNFLKSPDIASINNEIKMLHTCVHEFWEDKKIRKNFLNFQQLRKKKPVAYFKKIFAALGDGSNKANEDEEVEVGFVGGLFELYKLRKTKAKSELIANSAISTYNHQFGTFIFRNHIDYRSSLIESLIEPKDWNWIKQKEWKLQLLLMIF